MIAIQKNLDKSQVFHSRAIRRSVSHKFIGVSFAIIIKITIFTLKLWHIEIVNASSSARTI